MSPQLISFTVSPTTSTAEGVDKRISVYQTDNVYMSNVISSSCGRLVRLIAELSSYYRPKLLLMPSSVITRITDIGGGCAV